MCLNAGTSFKLLDQILDPREALSRNEVQQKKTPARTPLKDSRNLYLAKEGLILAGTPAAEGVSQSDLSKRLRLEQSKNQSLKNLNRFISMERLTVHNIPPSYDSSKLRQVIAKGSGLKVFISVRSMGDLLGDIDSEPHVCFSSAERVPSYA